MSGRSLLSLASLTIVLSAAACGGSVATQSAGSGASGAGGATGSTSGSATTGSTSGSATTGSTSGSTTASSTSGSATASSTSGTGGAGGGPCAGSVDLVVDNGAPQHLTSVCSGQWNPDQSMLPIGFIEQGGPPPGIANMNVVGCVDSAAGGEGIELSVPNGTTPGAYTTGFAQYTDGNGVVWGMVAGPYQVTFTAVGAVGEAVDGTFSTMVSDAADDTHAVAGSFHVCRAPDEDVP
jgi:hypothetical protein